MICLTSARFVMKADVLHQTEGTSTIPGDSDGVIDEAGEWITRQDPDTGEIIRIWQPNEVTDTTIPVPTTTKSFNCIARGITSNTVVGGGTLESFGELYDNSDYVLMHFPAHIKISKRDRVTNIRGRDNKVIWTEQEQPSEPPTIFNVNGVTPMIDPFGRHTENVALLERSEVQ